MVVDAEQCSDEGEYLTEGDEHRRVDFTHRRHDEAADQEAAADDYQRDGRKKLRSEFSALVRFFLSVCRSLTRLWRFFRSRAKSIVRFHLFIVIFSVNILAD